MGSTNTREHAKCISRGDCVSKQKLHIKEIQFIIKLV